MRLNFFSRNKTNEITKTFDRQFASAEGIKRRLAANEDTNRKRSLAVTHPNTIFNCEEDQNFDPNHIHIVVKKKERRVSDVIIQ